MNIAQYEAQLSQWYALAEGQTLTKLEQEFSCDRCRCAYRMIVFWTTPIWMRKYVIQRYVY